MFSILYHYDVGDPSPLALTYGTMLVGPFECIELAEQLLIRTQWKPLENGLWSYEYVREIPDDSEDSTQVTKTYFAIIKEIESPPARDHGDDLDT